MVQENKHYPWSSATARSDGQAGESIKLLDLDLRRELDGFDAPTRPTVDNGYFRQVMEIRECTHAGRPYGDSQFIAEMEERFQRQWRPVGRPKTENMPKREMGTERSATFAQMQISTGSG
jgi:hypothetical protein